MPFAGRQKLILAVVILPVLFAPVVAALLGQDPAAVPPTAAVSPSPGESASPSPTPPRAPSATPTPLPGAQNFHQWGAITVFNGLPSDSVRAIAQTDDGVMWFGTDNGLARFDGRRIQKMAFGDADASSILAMRTSPAGAVWIGTRAGAYVADRGRFTLIENTRDAAISAIHFGGENCLGTGDGMILRVRANENGTFAAERVLTEPLKMPDGTPLGISGIVEAGGSLIAGTYGRGAFTIADGKATEFGKTGRPLFVNAVSAGVEATLWIGSDAARGAGGVYSIGANGRTDRLSAPTAKVTALESNASGLWAGSERFGLFHFDGGKLRKAYTFANTSGGLRSDSIYALFTDREGVLWIGTNRGASRFDWSGPEQQIVSESANGNFIRTLYREPAGERTLFAGSNRGLFRSDGDKKWTEVPGLKGRVVYAVGEGHAGTPDGLFDLSGRKLLDGDVRGTASFNGREYAAVFGRGVVDIFAARGRVVFGDPTVTSLRECRGKLCIGTVGNGLFSFDGTSVKPEAGADALKSGTIWNMYQSADSGLLIAGQHGVFLLRDGQAEQVMNVEDVRDVIEQDGHIYAATTTRGLLHARRDERFGWLVSAMGFEQGLPSEKAFAISPEEDGLLIATNRGVVKFKPGTIAPKLIATRILSQRVHDLGESERPIALDHPQNSLLVEVAGQSSRTFPEEFQYSFVLTDGNNRTVDQRISNDPQYAPKDLSPGEYVIEARAYDRDLNASEPLMLRFSVATAPFPWTATSLGILLAIAVAGLVWAVIEHRRMTHRNRELAAARSDLANEAERERRRIARDLHDQTLADLRQLMMTSDKLIPDNGQFRAEIEAVSNEVRRICEDLSPSVLENVGLVAALEFLLSRSVKNCRFTAEENVEDRIRLPINVQLQIYRIAQEALSNIDRHSTAEKVEMTIAVNEAGEFAMTVRDDGPAFRPGSGNGSGRGISNIRSRANLINGKVAWKESRRGGNVFSLRVEAAS